MNLLKKIIIILMINILIFSVMGFFHNNEVKAATYLINEANLYSKGELVNFYYKDIKVGVQFVVYKKDGVEYPAYCLDRTLIGVTTEEGAKVQVNKALENAAVWRAVINGYPFKTPAELKCKSNIEAFAATKMAVYDALYNYNWSYFSPIDESGQRVLDAAESISKKARSSNETKPVGKVTIEQVTEEWAEDNKEEGYISKTYQVNTNVESTKYNIQLGNIQIENVKLTDEENKEKSEFSKDEKFKILIPISELETKLDVNTEFTIKATADLRTMPVLYGETADSNFQNYALAAGEWEFESTTIKEKYPSNKTKIKIIKEDAEEEIPLSSAKFNILDKNKEIVYSEVTTNQEGTVEVNGISPGKYYVEEIQAPDGYTEYEDLIEINVSFNECYIVNVKNYQKPEEEEKKIEKEKEVTVVGEKEIKLPRTGF